ncbi:MAG: transporter substrate-binding domain-containing protein [Euryarchaeota archaeon]|nr:transporter substrate-binding domain-containing protein [Euryarchaeota archaeon]
MPVGAAVDADPLSEAERAWVDAHGPIRWAIGLEFPPAFIDNGTRGYAVDLIRLMEIRLNIDFEIVRVAGFSNALESMKTGEADLIGPVTTSGGRQGYLDFTEGFVAIELGFWTRSDDLDGHSETELEGQRVAVSQNATSHIWLRENRAGITPVLVDDPQQGVRALASGEVDVLLGGVAPVAYHLREEKVEGVRLLGPPVAHEIASWGIPKGNETLLSIIEKGMSTIPREERAAIFARWTGYDLGPPVAAAPPPIVLSPTHWAVASVSGLLLVGLSIGNIVLRRQVEARTRDLRESEERLRQHADELSRSNEELSQFAYVASHDLREPLRMVTSYLSLLDERYDEVLDKDGREFMDHARDGAVRMQALIDDLLTLARVDTTAEEPRAVDTGEVLQEALFGLQVQLRDEGAEVVWGDLPQVRARKGQLRQLFQNLVSNGVKFHGTKPPKVEVEGTARADGMAVFAVRDNGIGIPVQEQEKVFALFHRLHGRDHNEGTGIGLALCKRIVERHGGRIWVESKEGEGTTVRFTLPVA